MSKTPRRVEVFRSSSGRYLEIDRLIYHAKVVGPHWFLAFPAAPRATYEAIRDGRHVDLKAMTVGRLEAQWRNEYIESGKRRGDVYVRYMEEETHG